MFIFYAKRVIPRYILLCIFVFTLSGCSSLIENQTLNSFAKSDVDMIADTSLHEMNRLMGDLVVKLYKRNPKELDKAPGMTIGQRQSQLFDNKGRLVFSEIKRKQGTDALNLAFDTNYTGDRVFALMCGLIGVVRSSYNWKTEQFMFDSLDQQKLFNSARNIEILAWRLSNSRDDSGKLLLLTNSQPGEEENLSYERLFGKMISIQDVMSFIIAGKWERGISSAFKKAVFLPMGL